MRRRAWLIAQLPLGVPARAGLAAVLLPGVTLAGCGFELRRAPDLPFASVALSGFAPRSPLAEELTRELKGSVRVVLPAERPEVVLLAMADRREKSIVAATAAGQVREVQLRVHFEFRLSAPGGRDLLPAATLALSRDMSYSETFALAKEQEEAQLYAAMQTEIVRLVLRRLARSAKA